MDTSDILLKVRDGEMSVAETEEAVEKALKAVHMEAHGLELPLSFSRQIL